MWPSKRRSLAAESKALLERLHARRWKNDAEREELLRAVAALPSLEAEDVAWMAVEPEVPLRQAGLALLKRFPYEGSAAALFPHLAAKNEAARRQAMSALEQLAGGAF